MKIKKLRLKLLGFMLYLVAISFGSAQSQEKIGKADIEVTVVATRKPQAVLETAGSTSAITNRAMLERGNLSLGDALKYESGVTVPFDFVGGSGFVPYLGGGDQGINIRGLDGNRILLSLDGIRQPEDFVAQAFLGQGGPGRIYFDPAVLSQLEIHKSSTSSLYGSDAMGGTVAAQTVNPESILGADYQGKSAKNSFTYSSVNNSFNNRFVGAFGNGMWGSSVVYSFRTGNERENNGDNAPNPEGFSSHALVSKLVYKEKEWSLSGTLDVYDKENTIEGNSSEGSLFNGQIINSVIRNIENKERNRTSLELDLQPLDAPKIYDRLKSQIYYQNSEASTESLQQGTAFFAPRDRLNEINYRTKIYGLDVQADKLLETSGIYHAMTYGGDYSFSDVKSSFLRTERAGAPTTSDRIGMAPSEVVRLGTFFQNEISFGTENQWILTPALRLDYYEISPENTEAFLARTVRPDNGASVKAVDYDNLSLAPSLSILNQLNENWNLYGLYSRGIRNPSAEEMAGVFTHGTDFIVVPNSDLTEETSDSFELGLQRNNNNFSFQIAGFYNLYDDFLESNVLIQDNPVTDVYTTKNRKEVEIYGIETKLDWYLGNGFSSGWSLTVQEGDQKRLDANGNEIEVPLNSINPLKMVSYLGYDSKNDWGLKAYGTYVADKDSSDIDTTDTSLNPTESYFVIDLNAYYKLNELAKIRVGVHNLLDEAYTSWSSGGRGAGHGSSSVSDRSTQPGLNGFVSLDLSF